MRFDFSHPRPLSADDIAAIEAEVNDRIRGNSEVRTRLLTPERAVAEGALALFGEKYGDEVRVVAMGGGGGRATTALFGRAVRRHACPPHRRYRPVQDRRRELGRLGRAPHRGADRRRRRGLSRRRRGLLRQAAAALRTSPAEMPARLAAPRRRASPARARARRGAPGARLASRPRPARPRGRSDIGDVAFDGRVVDDVPGRELRSLADDLKRRIGSGIVAVVSRADGKAAIVVGVTDDLTGSLRRGRAGPRSAPRRSAARAAAAAPTWRRPAGPSGPRRGGARRGRAGTRRACAGRGRIKKLPRLAAAKGLHCVVVGVACHGGRRDYLLSGGGQPGSTTSPQARPGCGSA